MLLNSKLFDQISFFLSNRTLVNSLEEGAIKHGGATKLEDVIYSNIEGDNNIKVNKDKNTMCLFVPSTLNSDEEITNTEYVNKYFSYLDNHFINSDIITHKTMGSWYSEDLKKVIIENITIIEVVIDSPVTQVDINYMLNLGLSVKNDMSQECVTVTVNDALCLV